MDQSWRDLFSQEFEKEYFKNLMLFLHRERQLNSVFPEEKNVFNAFNTPFNEVKVVIIGQDPYHSPKQAHGLSFSVLKPMKAPASLLNIYKELESDIIGWKRPDHGDLTRWSKNGVFLINSLLTVRAHNPASHKNQGWEEFTAKAISELSNRGKCVFVLWGSFAQSLGIHVDKSKNAIISSVHPSPLSAHRGFLGSKPFSKANQFLKDWGVEPLSWEL